MLIDELIAQHKCSLDDHMKEWVSAKKIEVHTKIDIHIQTLRQRVEEDIVLADISKLLKAKELFDKLLARYKGTGTIEDDWFQEQNTNIQKAISIVVGKPKTPKSSSDSANASTPQITNIHPRDIDPRTGKRRDIADL